MSYIFKLCCVNNISQALVVGIFDTRRYVLVFISLTRVEIHANIDTFKGCIELGF